MTFLKPILVLLFLCITLSLYSQDLQYVTAKNGLLIREKPDVSSAKMGKLAYLQAVECIENTNLKMMIVDDEEKIFGQWVKVKTQKEKNNILGYVFNGYLSDDMILGKTKITFNTVNVFIEDLETDKIEFESPNLVQVEVALGDTPEHKYVSIVQDQYKSVSVFQRYETSITVMNEGPHCDLTEWKHYNSDWKLLPQINTSQFLTHSYSEENWSTFVKVSIEDLKKEVKSYCGEFWSLYVKDAKNIHNYPFGISISRIFLKVVLIDFDGNSSEKTIVFNIPMGC